MRCWGRSTPADAKGLEFEHAECEMDTRVFVSGWLTTGSLTVRHEAYDGSKLGTLRFASATPPASRNEGFGGPATAHRTAPQCHERYVDRERPAAARGAVPVGLQEADRPVRRQRARRDRRRAAGRASRAASTRRA